MSEIEIQRFTKLFIVASLGPCILTRVRWQSNIINWTRFYKFKIINPQHQKIMGSAIRLWIQPLLTCFPPDVLELWNPEFPVLAMSATTSDKLSPSQDINLIKIIKLTCSLRIWTLIWKGPLNLSTSIVLDYSIGKLNILKLQGLIKCGLLIAKSHPSSK